MKSSLEAVLDKKIYGAAARYSENNNLQLHYGKKLATKVGIKQGDKILDMGCGTGELTLCIGEIIGKKGRVVGVDPDIERIHYAIQHNCNVNENVSFEIGDSSSEFLQRNKSFYDIHFSNFSFQWLTLDEKKMFLQTAFHCLKPSGKIAIQSHEGYPEIALYVECLMSKRQNALTDINDKKPIQFFMSKSEATSLIEEMGFEIISSDYDVGK
ncbi:phosphomethylethanolamine N-methyltransferase-like [Xenia sp. Carnegie-2017]|uniref:phosphomethylethanolamine N-methyltransferase-like n=1 Tax=Xenia sp. Carnegie-2017 TaxID=2897299 RepID=UPI001F0467F0|nr:phosphomethylethanolamine N-methyltransferase-like [Xenia sp. Carnegie-2017]